MKATETKTSTTTVDELLAATELVLQTPPSPPAHLEDAAGTAGDAGPLAQAVFVEDSLWLGWRSVEVCVGDSVVTEANAKKARTICDSAVTETRARTLRVISKRGTDGSLYSPHDYDLDGFGQGGRSDGTPIPVTAITSVLPRVAVVVPTRQMRLAGVFGPLKRLQRGLQPHLGASGPVVAALGTTPNGAAVGVARLTCRGADDSTWGYTTKPCDVPSPELELCLAGQGGDDGSGPNCRIVVAVFSATHSAAGARCDGLSRLFDRGAELCSVCETAVAKHCNDGGGARARDTVVVVAHPNEAEELIAAAKRPFFVTSVVSVASKGDVIEFSNDQITRAATRKLNGKSDRWHRIMAGGSPGYMHLPDLGIRRRRRAAFCSIFAVNTEARARVDAEISSLEASRAGAPAQVASAAVGADDAAHAARLRELRGHRQTLLPTLPAELAALICRIAFAADHALPAVHITAKSNKNYYSARVFPCCGMVSNGDVNGDLQLGDGRGRKEAFTSAFTRSEPLFTFEVAPSERLSPSGSGSGSPSTESSSSESRGAAPNPAMVYDVMTDTVRAPRDGAKHGAVDQPARPWELALPRLRPAVLPAEMTAADSGCKSDSVQYTKAPCDRRFVPPWGTPHAGELELHTPGPGGCDASASWTCCRRKHRGDVTSRCTKVPAAQGQSEDD